MKSVKGKMSSVHLTNKLYFDCYGEYNYLRYDLVMVVNTSRHPIMVNGQIKKDIKCGISEQN